MAQKQVQSFLNNIESLTTQYELLKQHALKLDNENKNLKQENNHLAHQHNEAKLALQQIMEQFKGLQA
jgi:regulator of replication initiation timing